MKVVTHTSFVARATFYALGNTTVATTSEAVDDFQLDFEEDEPAPVPPVASPPPAKKPSLADSTKPAPVKKEAAIPPPKEESAADDAVADFLLGLKIDDDD